MPREAMFRPKGALPSRRTPIEDWPVEWLRWVEPKIERGPLSEGDHWFWTGYSLNGIPRLVFKMHGGGQKRVAVSNFVVGLFWYIHPDLLDLDAGGYNGFKPWFVEQSCGYRNCLNPQHLIPRVRDGFGASDEHL